MFGLIQVSCEVKYRLIHDELNRPLGTTGDIYANLLDLGKIKDRTSTYIISLQIIQVHHNPETWGLAEYM